jgi:hypothetical protein
MDGDISTKLDAMVEKLSKDIAKSTRKMIELLAPQGSGMAATAPAAPVPEEVLQEPLSPPTVEQPQTDDGLATFSELVLPSYSTQPASYNEPLSPPTLKGPSFHTDELRFDRPKTEQDRSGMYRQEQLPPPKLAAFRPSPPPPVPLDQQQRFAPPVEPLSLPTDAQDLRHSFPHGHPYQADVAEMQLYDEATDDLHNVAITRSRTESDYRRRELELHTQTQHDLNNDYRQLDDLTRRAELSRETITDRNI